MSENISKINNNSFEDQDFDHRQGVLLVQSLQLLRPTVIPNVLFIILGSLALVTNCVVLAVIKNTKSLHTKCFYLLAANAVSDMILGIGYVITGAKRLYRYYTGIGELINMWTCCWEMSVCTFAQSLSLSMAVSLIIDRLLAICYPHKYKIWSCRTLTIPLCLSAHILAGAQLFVHIFDSWQSRSIILISCSIDDTAFSKDFTILISLQIAISILVVVSNCILAVKSTIKRRQSTNRISNNINGTNTVELQLQLQRKRDNTKEMKVFRTVTILVILHILTHTGGRLVILIVKSISSDERVQTITNRYMRELVVFNAAINFFVLLATSELFRKATKNLLTNKNSGSIGTESGARANTK